MLLKVLAGFHVFHPNLVEENLLVARENLDPVSLDQVEIGRDLLDEFIWFDILQDLLVAFDQFINIGLVELHHELFTKLQVERYHFEDQRILLMAKNADYVLNALDVLTSLAEQGEVSQVVMG